MKTLDGEIEQFEVVKNESEHQNNCLHREVKKLYHYYREMGLNEGEAVRCAIMQYRNVVLPNKEKERK